MQPDMPAMPTPSSKKWRCVSSRDTITPHGSFRQDVVPGGRLFLTWLERERMNRHYQEADAVVLFAAVGVVFRRAESAARFPPVAKLVPVSISCCC